MRSLLYEVSGANESKINLSEYSFVERKCNAPERLKGAKA